MILRFTAETGHGRFPTPPANENPIPYSIAAVTKVPRGAPVHAPLVGVLEAHIEVKLAFRVRGHALMSE